MKLCLLRMAYHVFRPRSPCIPPIVMIFIVKSKQRFLKFQKKQNLTHLCKYKNGIQTFTKAVLHMNEIWYVSGLFINHVNIARGRGFVKCPYYSKNLILCVTWSTKFQRPRREEVKNVQKLSPWVMDDAFTSRGFYEVKSQFIWTFSRVYCTESAAASSSHCITFGILMPGINPLVATPLRNVRTAWSPQTEELLEKWCEFFTHFPFKYILGV